MAALSSPRLSSLSVLFVAALFMVGCASSREPATARYSASQNEMMYRASDISLGTMFPTGGLSRDPSVALRSWATCSGENCQPQRVWFSFVLRSSMARSNVLASRNVEMVADGNVHEWPEERQQFADRTTSTASSMQLPGSSGNELTRISMSLSTLQEIAQADGVSGTFGGEDFSLSYDDRAPLRAFAEKMAPARQPQ